MPRWLIASPSGTKSRHRPTFGSQPKSHGSGLFTSTTPFKQPYCTSLRVFHTPSTPHTVAPTHWVQLRSSRQAGAPPSVGHAPTLSRPRQSVQVKETAFEHTVLPGGSHRPQLSGPTHGPPQSMGTRWAASLHTTARLGASLEQPRKVPGRQARSTSPRSTRG